MKVKHDGRLLIVGCGVVSGCFQSLLLKHLDMDFSKLTLLDLQDCREKVTAMLDAGARFVHSRISRQNFSVELAKHVGPGDILVDLAWNIDTADIVEWCQTHGVRYLNTSIEVWDPCTARDGEFLSDSIYERHTQLAERARKWSKRAPTAVIEHGANPGLVSHWTKLGLEQVAERALRADLVAEPDRRRQLETALGDRDYPMLAWSTGTKVIHISERDSQQSVSPREPGQFVSTWSPEGFHQEAVAYAELAWGTHERLRPADAIEFTYGPGNHICLPRKAMHTVLRSWVPDDEILGMLMPHGETYTISNRLTVWNDDSPVYRPTICFVYSPSPAALESLAEISADSYALPKATCILNDEIAHGSDDLGVLLLGHHLGGWWVGSKLGIHEARKCFPKHNATVLQVGASALAALFYVIRYPNKGLCLPGDLPHEEVLATANPYLGSCVAVQTDWGSSSTGGIAGSPRHDGRMRSLQLADFMVDSATLIGMRGF